MSSQYKYLRVCYVCGDAKAVKHRPKKDTMCKACALKVRDKPMTSHRWDGVAKKRYYYFCPTCDNVSIAIYGGRKSHYCSTCNRRYNRVPPLQGYYDLDLGKYIITQQPYFTRVCSECGDIRRVRNKQESEAKLCGACSRSKNGRVGKRKPSNKPKPKPRTTKAKSKMSPERIAAIREQNRKHREEMARLEKQPVVQTKTDEEMIEEWLKHNQPKQCSVNSMSHILEDVS
jgi:Zn finger protein HypA/HybF involved in hydrogenase expression